MAQDATMRAIVQVGYGSPEVLRPARVHRPAPAANEVLIRVRAAGIDRGTWHLMAGQPYVVRLGIGLRKPRDPVAGMDTAGVVVAAGAAVTKFAVGDEVFGASRGAFAEYAVAREDKLARKPGGLDFEQAAVIAVSGVTALTGLRDVGRVQAGQRVLVIGASGGVGSYAVQLAKSFGAEVTGVCRTDKVDFVRSLGADHVIDYTRSDFADGGAKYDVIMDIGGGSRLSRLRRALTPRGTLVITGGEGESAGKWIGLGRQARALALSPFVRQRLTTYITRQKCSDMETLGALIDAGKVTPAVGATYPLAEVPEAVRYLLSGHAKGKIAITV